MIRVDKFVLKYESDNEWLAHHGILGQKWGVRRFQNEDGSLTAEGKKRYTNSGRKTLIDTNTGTHMTENDKSRFAEFLSKFSPKVAERQSNFKDYTIFDKSGNKFGVAMVEYQDGGKTLYGNWIGVKAKHQSNGYGQSAMKLLIDDAKKDGVEKFTLEVPGNSPNAKHIYEKLGFTETGEVLGDENDVWGSLTKMSLNLNERKRK